MILTESTALAESSSEWAPGRPPRSDFNTVRLSALRRMKWFELYSDNKGGTAYFTSLAYVVCVAIYAGDFIFL